MKPIKTFAAVLSLSLLLSGHGHAASVTANIVNAGAYSDGRVFVTLSAPLADPVCPQSRFDVAPTNPAGKTALATAYAAIAAGKSIVVTTVGCYGGFPTLDTTAGSVFYIVN